MNKPRDHNRRILYNQYATMSKVLTEKLNSGKITQEQFDYEHETLDERYNSVR